jgi:thiamine-phosphate pyrophosphorylase
MFSLVVISHAELFPGEATIIQQLFEAGMDHFHLRKPDADEQAIRQLLDVIPAEWHQRIALHSHHQLVQDYDIQRLHFTEAHRGAIAEEALFEMKNKGYILSTSVHDLVTLEQLSACFSYTFFSPVFDSISKQQYKGVAGDAFYIRDEQKAVPVIALGGIDAGNIQSVAAMNFNGAAVLGTIWNEPAKAVANYKSLLTQLQVTHTP